MVVQEVAVRVGPSMHQMHDCFRPNLERRCGISQRRYLWSVMPYACGICQSELKYLPTTAILVVFLVQWNVL